MKSYGARTSICRGTSGPRYHETVWSPIRVVWFSPVYPSPNALCTNPASLPLKPAVGSVSEALASSAAICVLNVFSP